VADPPRRSPAPASDRSHASQWALGLIAIAYVGYLALLITCDLLRVEPLGFAPVFANGRVTIERVQAESVAARQGLQPHDRLVRANGQALSGRGDWQRVRVQLDPSRPLELEVERDGRRSTVRLPLSAGAGEWLSGPPRPGLVGFRLAQVITLSLALLVAFRRASQPAALLGAWLLASFATVSYVLPMRMFDFWQGLPQPLRALLWLPHATSTSFGPLLFAFVAVFPRRTWSTSTLLAALMPGVMAMGWFVYVGYQLTQELGAPTGLPDSKVWLVSTGSLYAFAAVGLLLAHQRRADSVTDRRRARVLLSGLVLGVSAGAALLVVDRLDGGADIFGNPFLTVLALASLAVPAAFAYAILRHRLFDLRVIVRQGVRYALARRLLDAVLPAVTALLIAELMWHGNEPLATMVRSRWAWYVLIVGALVLVRNRRESWLRALDRRFFRERYDAERLLANVVNQIERAPTFESIAPSVVQQIDEALHPTFVEVFQHAPGTGSFTPVTGLFASTLPLPAGMTAIGVLSALRKPLALSLGDTAWVRHQLPAGERTLLSERGVELLVPVFGADASDRPIALVVLGPRRSEEPYDSADLDLLTSIGEGLGHLLERSWTGIHGLAECGRCGRCFDGGSELCASDGTPLSKVRGARMLNDRYRLDRRLGRGGMGTVYEALDDVLERRVAVKVIRDDVAASAVGPGLPTGLEARFRQEARAAAGFAHDHVVRIYDFGVDRDRRAFLVMELLEGETLRQRLASRGPMRADEALPILRGVCQALTAAHGRGLLHRDLKPENIFLQRHDNGVLAKVLDFGLAKAFAVDHPSAGTQAPSDSAGFLLGTLDYMAPEQVAGDLVSPSWDVWALGVIAYEMLTAGHPFRRTIAVADARLQSVAPGSVSGPQHAALPDAAAAFFDQALSSDRTRRPASPLEFLAACEKVLA
jgi:hypothetical protein